MATTSQPKIKLTDVVKRFGDKSVLDGINLSVEHGELVAIIGGSGTGKSVMLKCILGLLKPESGSITVDGEEVVGARGRELGAGARQVRHAVPGRSAVRFDAGVAKRHLRAHAGTLA